jgi:hypothetical protein
MICEFAAGVVVGIVVMVGGYHGLAWLYWRD